MSLKHKVKHGDYRSQQSNSLFKLFFRSPMKTNCLIDFPFPQHTMSWGSKWDYSHSLFRVVQDMYRDDLFLIKRSSPPSPGLWPLSKEGIIPLWPVKEEVTVIAELLLSVGIPLVEVLLFIIF